jgi:hypothetical protein
MSNEDDARDFRRLADRLQAVLADTSMMTISPEYAAHFLEVHVKRTENAKFTSDRVRFLILTLPCLVLDLIAPEVSRYSLNITYINNGLHVIYQVYELNKKISAASQDRDSPLFNVQQVVDPSNEITEGSC